LEFREFGDIIFSPGATTGLETSRMVFNAAGNAVLVSIHHRQKIHIDGGSDADFTNTSGYSTIGNTGTTNLVIDDNESCHVITVRHPDYFCKTPEEMLVSIVNAAEPLAALDVNGTVKLGTVGTVIIT
jgi:hypothetical protein